MSSRRDHPIGRVIRDLDQGIAARISVRRLDHEAARGLIAIAHHREHLLGLSPSAIRLAKGGERGDVKWVRPARRS